MFKSAAFLMLFATSAAADVGAGAGGDLVLRAAPVIRVTGLPPLHPVTMRATSVDASGSTFTQLGARRAGR
ncbi:MAG TPA: hypothetical protein VND45_01560 [Thermoanaerobaculia bacterium]|jgi:hypothetical protein|nr:hypothetical protein [Thermoanaerobaculia bacterium]